MTEKEAIDLATTAARAHWHGTLELVSHDRVTAKSLSEFFREEFSNPEVYKQKYGIEFSETLIKKFVDPDRFRGMQPYWLVQFIAYPTDPELRLKWLSVKVDEESEQTSIDT